MPPARPTLVVVSGPAGSGKTTLAHRLAATLRGPAICRDEIKEGMAHAAGAYEPEFGDDHALRTLAVFFDVLHLLLERGVSVVAHPDAALLASLDQSDDYFTNFNRVAIDAPTIAVDTSDGYEPSIEAIVAFVDTP